MFFKCSGAVSCYRAGQGLWSGWRGRWMASNTKIFWGEKTSCPLEQKHNAQVKEEFHLSTWQQGKAHGQINHWLRHKQNVLSGFLHFHKLCGLIRREECTEKELSVWREGWGTNHDSDGLRWWKLLQKGHACYQSNKCGEFSFSIFNTLSEISCFSFSYLSLATSAYPNENGKKNLVWFNRFSCQPSRQ